MKVAASRVGRGSCEIDATGAGAIASGGLAGGVTAALVGRITPLAGGVDPLGEACAGVSEGRFSAAAKALGELQNVEHRSRARASDPKVDLHFWDPSDAPLFEERIVRAKNRNHFFARCAGPRRR